MVRGRSEAARFARYRRARDRGFLLPKPKDSCYVEVDGRLAPAVKTLAKSLAIHANHDAMSGSAHHHARQATLLVKDDISENEFKASMSWHKKGGQAKHNISKSLAAQGCSMRPHSWADVTDDSLFGDQRMGLCISVASSGAPHVADFERRVVTS
jgi:hypothetical protein